MSNKYHVELTDTFGGEANYSWVRRAIITMPELTHYGYDGGANYGKASRVFNRELMRKAKAAMGLAGVRGRSDHRGDSAEFRPYRMCLVMFISWADDE